MAQEMSKLHHEMRGGRVRGPIFLVNVVWVGWFMVKGSTDCSRRIILQCKDFNNCIYLDICLYLGLGRDDESSPPLGSDSPSPYVLVNGLEHNLSLQSIFIVNLTHKLLEHLTSKEFFQQSPNWNASNCYKFHQFFCKGRLHTEHPPPHMMNPQILPL